MPVFGEGQHERRDGRYLPPGPTLFQKFRNWMYFRRDGSSAPDWGPGYVHSEDDHRVPLARRYTVPFPSDQHVQPVVPPDPRSRRAYTYPQPGNSSAYPYHSPPHVPPHMYPSYPPLFYSPEDRNAYPQVQAPVPLNHSVLVPHGPRSQDSREVYQAQRRTNAEEASRCHPSFSAPFSTYPQRQQEDQTEERQRRGSMQPNINSQGTKGGVIINPRAQTSSRANVDTYHLLTELIPTVACFPSVDWNICFPMSSAFKWVGPGKKGLLIQDTIAVIPIVHNLRIYPRKDNDALSFVLVQFGEIRVSAARPLIVGDLLEAIKVYFERPLKDAEMESLDPMLRKHVMSSFQRRWDAQGTERNGETWPKLPHSMPTRVDLLFDSFQYAGLEMDSNFGKTRKLYLKLENRQTARTE